MGRSYFQEVVSDKIDWKDRLYFLPNIRAGQIKLNPVDLLPSPILLQEKAGNRFRIIDGFLTFKAAFERSRRSAFPAAVFPRQMSPVTLWRQRVRKRKLENNLSSFGLIEGLVNLLEGAGFDRPPEETNFLLRENGFSPAEISLDRVKQTRDKIYILGDAVDRLLIGRKEIIALESLEKEKLVLMAELFKGLKLKGNKLSAVLETINDLERRAAGLKVVLEDEIIKEIPEKTPPSRRYKLIKERLLRLRFPKWSALTEDWKRALKKVDLPCGTEIRNDPFFEADDLRIELKFSSPEELKAKLAQIDRAANSREFKRLFEFL